MTTSITFDLFLASYIFWKTPLMFKPDKQKPNVAVVPQQSWCKLAPAHAQLVKDSTRSDREQYKTQQILEL